MGQDSSGDVLTGGVTFTFEPIKYMIQHGLVDMSRRHWEETVSDKDILPYNPNWDHYFKLEADEMFRMVAVRLSGHLIGYAGLRLAYNINSKEALGCHIQEYYIDKPFRRKADCGKRLFSFIHYHLAAIKVAYIVVEAPIFSRSGKHSLGRYFRSLGYSEIGEMWARRA